MKLEAVHLRGSRYAVRPEGQLGTHGSKGGILWEVIYINANSEKQAVEKAARKLKVSYSYN